MKSLEKLKFLLRSYSIHHIIHINPLTMVKFRCCFFRCRDDACELGDMRSLTNTTGIICGILVAISILSCITFASLHACLECKHYHNKTFAGYDNDYIDAGCLYQTNGKDIRRDRVYNISCRNKVLIGVGVSVGTLFLLSLIFTMTCCRANANYDDMAGASSSSSCINHIDCAPCFDDKREYPATNRLYFNLQLFSISFGFAVVVLLVIVLLPLIIIGAIVYFILYGCYIFCQKFCPVTCGFCTCDMTVSEDYNEMAEDSDISNNSTTKGEPIPV